METGISVNSKNDWLCVHWQIGQLAVIDVGGSNKPVGSDGQLVILPELRSIENQFPIQKGTSGNRVNRLAITEKRLTAAEDVVYGASSESSPVGTGAWIL